MIGDQKITEQHWRAPWRLMLAVSGMATGYGWDDAGSYAYAWIAPLQAMSPPSRTLEEP